MRWPGGLGIDRRAVLRPVWPLARVRGGMVVLPGMLGRAAAGAARLQPDLGPLLRVRRASHIGRPNVRGDNRRTGESGVMAVAETRFMPQNAEPPMRKHRGPVANQSSLRGETENGNHRWLHFQHPLGRNARGMPSMVEYTIAALPTLYRGRMYRSRLEARWAAFFDRLGWAYEYEPFDLGSWSPDFLLTEQNVLVEVKPLTEFDQSVANKMLDAAEEARFPESGDGCGLFLTRVAPHDDGLAISLGWLCSQHAPNVMTSEFCEAHAVWRPNTREPLMIADAVSSNKDAAWTMGGAYRPMDNPSSFFGWIFYKPYLMGLWAEASNAVQWERGQ
jgi:hypothetical protein